MVSSNSFIPCQEEGNVEYVLKNKTGAFSRNPERIAAIVEVCSTPNPPPLQAFGSFFFT